MRKLKRKYKRPRILWNVKQIEDDKATLTEFGMRRKREIWRTQEMLRNFRRRARELNSTRDKLKEKELVTKIAKLGMLPATANLDDVLGLTLQDILNRRLQTIVLKKGLSSTAKQARQLITHGHIVIGEIVIKFPSYIVEKSEEELIKMNPQSADKFKAPEKPQKPAPVKPAEGANRAVEEVSKEEETTEEPTEIEVENTEEGES